FNRSGKSSRDCRRMYLKTAIILTWFAASYGLLVFGPTSWFTTPLLVLSASLSLAAIAFNIQHDGGHQAYSRRSWVNRLAASAMDFIGASSYVWRYKHGL